ncbi:MAG: CAAX prenyl protease-related protein [Planctomycetota bacterium]|jgi:CAAX prenyl protease-like protein
MPEEPVLNNEPSGPRWVGHLGRKQPDIIMMGPFMLYLLLLGLNDRVPESYMPVTIAIRGIGALWLVWLFRRHLAAGWVAGQHFFNGIAVGSKSLGGGLLNWFELSEVSDPRVNISTFSWRAQMVLRITVACTAVPVVEEIFWRGFLLRALINWDRFETIPLGTFTWFSFLATSLLSVLEHPDNWAVSILCWFVYNALMYWKKSILFLIITHGITNLALYIYVIVAQDWLFW